MSQIDLFKNYPYPIEGKTPTITQKRKYERIINTIPELRGIK